MRILGIDPGLQITGYGVIEFRAPRVRLIDAGIIRLASRAPLASRLVELQKELDVIIAETHPDLCAVEQLYAHYAHPRTALLMAHARGVILLCAARQDIPLHEYAANRVKQSVVGHGHAAKGQVQRAIQVTFNLPELPAPPDVADALAIALCCARQLVGPTIRRK